MSKFMTAVIAAALLGLSGCGTMSNMWGPEKLVAGKPGDDTGIVLLSAGAPKNCIAQSTFLKVMPDGEKYRGRELALLSVDAYTLKSDFDDHFGSVHALRLAAGSYYLTTWVANPYLYIVNPPRYDFSVSAGETVYLGEWLMAAECSGGAGPRVLDMWERDSAIISKRNPAIDLSMVNKRMVSASPGGAPS